MLTIFTDKIQHLSDLIYAPLFVLTLCALSEIEVFIIRVSLKPPL